MLIIPDYDAEALAAPQSFRNGIQIAIDILDAAFSANITVKIAVGYGEKDGIPLPDPNISKGGFSGGVTISYASLRSDLLAASDIDATSTSLPSGASVNGVSNFLVSPTQERNFRPASRRSTAPPRTTAASEWGPDSQAMSWFRAPFTSSLVPRPCRRHGYGPRHLPVYQPWQSLVHRRRHGRSRLFFDGRRHNRYCGFWSDVRPGDFLNPPASNRTRNDPFNEDVGNLGGLTATDREIMDALGFAVTNPRAVSNDFNDDQFSDVLWRNNSFGLADWSMTGGAINSAFVTSGGRCDEPRRELECGRDS